MSTRANVDIITEQGTFKFQSNSSAYPSNIGDSFVKLIGACASNNAVFNGKIGFYEPSSIDLSTFIDEVGLSLGHVGNFTYWYMLDFVKERLTIWDVKIRWVNAPEDWKVRGWNCWIGKNGRYGYDNWVKGKKIIDESFHQIVTGMKVVDYEGIAIINKDSLKRIVEAE